MEVKVSVIVPIYNLENYIGRCIESILKQTMNEIEIILINDGSKDRSLEICKKYEQSDERIRLYDIENQGVSYARNLGIQYARGQYYCFVDGDDYVSECFVEELYQACIKNQCLVAVSKVARTNNDGCDFSNTKKTKVCTGKEAVLKMYGTESERMILPTNKIYHSSLFTEILFPVGRINEDVFTTYKLLYEANRVCLVEDVLYAYFISPNSIMRSEFSSKRYDILYAYLERIEYFEEKNDLGLYNITNRSYFNRLVNAYLLTKRYIKENETICEGLKDEIKKQYKVVKKIKKYEDLKGYENYLVKVKSFLGRYLPGVYNVLFLRGQSYI